MRTYLVGQDLNKVDKDYKELIDNIKKLSATWWHCLDSTWLIKTNSSAEQIRNALWSHIDSNDELLVVSLTGESAWAGFNEEWATWLRNNMSYEQLLPIPQAYIALCR